MTVENWRTTKDDITAAVALQAMIREAEITWAQVDVLLGVPRGRVGEYCRGHESVPPPRMQKIKEILDGVKTGKIKAPIV
jgi:hypothetical protein